MADSTGIRLEKPETFKDQLTEMLRSGARQLAAQAVEAELQELLAVHAGRRTPDGRAAVVRNGYQPEREIVTGIWRHRSETEPPIGQKVIHPRPLAGSLVLYRRPRRSEEGLAEDGSGSCYSVPGAEGGSEPALGGPRARCEPQHGAQVPGSGCGSSCCTCRTRAVRSCGCTTGATRWRFSTGMCGRSLTSAACRCGWSTTI